MKWFDIPWFQGPVNENKHIVNKILCAFSQKKVPLNSLLFIPAELQLLFLKTPKCLMDYPLVANRSATVTTRKRNFLFQTTYLV